MHTSITDPSVPGSQRRLRIMVEILWCEGVVFTLGVGLAQSSTDWRTLVLVEMLALFWLGALALARTCLEGGRIERAVALLAFSLLLTVTGRMVTLPITRPVGAEALTALVLAFIYLSRRWLVPLVACIACLGAGLAWPHHPWVSSLGLNMAPWLAYLVSLQSYAICTFMVLAALWDYRQRWSSLLVHNREALIRAEGVAEQNRRLQALTAAMVRPMSMEALLRVAVEQRTSILRATMAWAHLADERGNLQLVASHGLGQYGQGLGEAMLELASPAMAAHQSGHAVWLENRQALVLAYGQLVEPPGASTIAAMVALPLHLERQELGVITLAFAEPMRWSRSERRLLMTAASLLAQALERSRLHEAEVLAHGKLQHLMNDLRRALRVREEFLMVAGHELRTPLAALQLQIQSMYRRMGDCADAPVLAPWRQKLGRAVDHTLRLGHLVDTLLEVSQLSGGPMRLQRERLDLADLLRESVDLVHEPASRSGSVLHLDADMPVDGFWDRRRLEQVLVNLLGNAIKYGEGKPVEITLRPEGDDAVITVVDHGIGIVAADLDRIFGKFERAVSERHYGGMGVGLWVTRQIIEAHGGRIEVRSEPGSGSAFSVHLPRWQAAAAAPSTSAQTAPAQPPQEERAAHE